MKKIILFIFLPLSIYSQSPVKVEGLYESIQTTFRKGGEGISECYDNNNDNDDENILCPDKLISAIQLDVFKYFDLELTYTSALQKNSYMETQDYKDKLSELKLIKNDYTSHNLYIELSEWYTFEIGDYDLKKGGFYIYLGIDYQGVQLGNWPLVLSPYLLRQLPLNKSYFFFPINKVMALEIENGIKKNVVKKEQQLKMILLFKPSGVVKIKYPKRDNATRTLVTTDKVEVIILDAVTSILYYRKSFVNSKK